MDSSSNGYGYRDSYNKPIPEESLGKRGDFVAGTTERVREMFHIRLGLPTPNRQGTDTPSTPLPLKFKGQCI